MKIIKIAAEGINLFKDRIDIDFYAEKRVLSDNSEMVSNLFGRFFTNNVISVVGINAAGKTSLLKFISFVFNYVNGMSINTISEREVFTDSREINIEVIFYTEEKGLCKLSSKIVRKHINKIEEKYIVEEEKLFVKDTSKVKSKKDLISFDDSTFLFKNILPKLFVVFSQKIRRWTSGSRQPKDKNPATTAQTVIAGFFTGNL